MQLLFLRHGIAVDHGAPGYETNDDARPLTDKGIKVVKRVARALDGRVQPDVILTSPLPRARQTADLVAAQLGAPVIETPLLGLGFSAGALAEALRLAADRLGGDSLRRVMLVGHEPSMSHTIGVLISGSPIGLDLPKTGLARVDVANETLQGANLVWLIPAGVWRGGKKKKQARQARP